MMNNASANIGIIFRCTKYKGKNRESKLVIVYYSIVDGYSVVVNNAI